MSHHEDSLEESKMPVQSHEADSGICSTIVSNTPHSLRSVWKSQACFLFCHSLTLHSPRRWLPLYFLVWAVFEAFLPDVSGEFF